MGTSRSTILSRSARSVTSVVGVEYLPFAGFYLISWFILGKIRSILETPIEVLLELGRVPSKHDPVLLMGIIAVMSTIIDQSAITLR
jgi:hypothetical protein